MVQLNNGAQVVEARPIPSTGGHIVIAKRDTSAPHPYVTWQVNDKGDAFFGHYFATLLEAVVDFEERRW